MSELTVEQLDARLLAWTRESQHQEGFEQLILDVFRHQHAHNPAYRRWCEQHNAGPDTVRHWRDIPAVPQVAFKEWTLAAFDASRAVARFDSSGTTADTPGRHYFDTLHLYEAAIVPPFRRYVLPDDAGLRCVALLPDPAERPHSSLAYMAGVVGRECCGGNIGYFVHDDRLDVDGVLAEVGRAAGPVLVFATAFALVHLLDRMQEQDAKVSLPAGSRVVETGGYKGRTREVPKAELYGLITEHLGVPPPFIVNEYGMTELSSQWYDTVLYDFAAGTGGESRWKAGPPWTRARAIDPRSGDEAAPGEVGLLRLYDPMNRGSVCCVQTEDLGRRMGNGFEVLGRATDADLRGCSLDLDVFS